MTRGDCLYCGTKEVVAQKTLEFEGTMYSRLIKFMGPGRRCMNCKRRWATREDLKSHFPLMADSVRDDMGLLRIDFLEKVRKTRKLPRHKFVAMINMKSKQYAGFLVGRIQTAENDELMREGLGTFITEEEVDDGRSKA